jgi:hypothetical protein
MFREHFGALWWVLENRYLFGHGGSVSWSHHSAASTYVHTQNTKLTPCFLFGGPLRAPIAQGFVLLSLDAKFCKATTSASAWTGPGRLNPSQTTSSNSGNGSSSNGNQPPLNTGAIIGITIAIAILAALIGAVAMYLMIKKRRAAPASGDNLEDDSAPASPTMTESEIKVCRKIP